MKRLIVVYNPRSSGYERVKAEVMTPIRKLKGWMVGRFEVLDTNVDDNARRLAKLLKNDDLVLAVGGDAVASVAVNGVMRSGFPDVRLAVLAYGNFNDVAKSFGNLSLQKALELFEQSAWRQVWPLACWVDGKVLRYGMNYFTVGMLAESCTVFDEVDIRRKLHVKKMKMLFSLKQLVKWWIKHRKAWFLPDFRLIWRNGEISDFTDCTDYIALNNLKMAKIMKGKEWCLSKTEFQSSVECLRRFGGVMRFMLTSMWKRVPGEVTEGDVLKFRRETKVMVQAEGEYKRVLVNKTLEFKKAQRPIWVVGDFRS